MRRVGVERFFSSGESHEFPLLLWLLAVVVGDEKTASRGSCRMDRIGRMGRMVAGGG
jgi:hypothetical protein